MRILLNILLLLGEQLEQHDIVLLRNQLKSQLLRLLEHRRIGMLSGDHVPEQPLPAGFVKEDGKPL